MEELLSNPKGSEALMFMVFAVVGGLSAIVCTIAVQWRKARQAEAMAVLKQEMIQRGMSADDIVRVIQAGKSKEPSAETACGKY